MESFYRKWLQKNRQENEEAQKLLQLPVENSDKDERELSSQNNNEGVRDESQNNDEDSESQNNDVGTQNSAITRIIDFQSSLPNIVFEEGNLQLIIEKGDHIRQRKFRLEDHLFYLKIKLKNPNLEVPYLRDILNFLEVGFDYIISEVRKFYDNNDHNVGYLTLYQQPMINGLNTGGFDIQENGSEIVERVLKMLEQFLISNQTLKLDNTFKVFLKVLSISHIKYNKTNKRRTHRKRTKEFYKRRKTVGSRKKPIKKFNYFWALDVPDSFTNEPYPNVFKEKCLITATVLGLLQNSYFESNRKDLRFLYAQNINSVNVVKQNQAGKIILTELNKIVSNVELNPDGPYDLEETTKKLSEFYKCQFFIFDGMHNSNKLLYMYPENYEDSLQPIYLYRPHEAKNHLVFIRNYHSYCRANVKICFGCKKTFLTYNYRHLCPKKKCCFSCRRFFLSPNTYIHEKLKEEFCDKNRTSEEAFTCPRCNVTCYSKHCQKGHNVRCTGQGTFGFKCLKCNKFTYRHGKINGKNLRENHVCGNFKTCLNCRQPKDLNHQCRIKTEFVPKVWPKLAFIGMEHFDSSSENCIDCSRVRCQNLFFCEKHTIQTKQSDEANYEPIAAIIYAEEKSFGTFTKYFFDNFESRPHFSKSEDILNFDYVPKSEIFQNSSECDRKSKITQDFKQIMNFSIKILHSAYWINYFN